VLWVFDVDGCLIDSLTGTSLRPGTAELLEHLRAEGHRVLLWSAGGADYAAGRAAEAGVGHLVHGCHGKERRDDAGRYLPPFRDELDSVVFVDDRPEDMPVAADVVSVSPYLAPNVHDRGLAEVARRAGLVPTMPPAPPAS
jgi:long-chain acyl-CoA synthetase